MSEKLSQTAEMLQRIHALEEQVKLVPELQQQVQSLQQGIVSTCAQQLQNLFTNQVLVDSIAHRFFMAAANAIAFKARQSEHQAPELVVIEGYVPGALRAILNEDGSINIDQQLKGATNAGSTWESATASFEEKGILDSFQELLSAYGAEAGRTYFVLDSVSIKNHREKVARDLASDTSAASPETAAPAGGDAPHDMLVHVSEEGELVNGLIIPAEANVTVTRNGETADVPAAALTVGDVFVYEAAADKVYTGTVSTVEATPKDAPKAPEADDADGPALDLPEPDVGAEDLSEMPGDSDIDQASADDDASFEPGDEPADLTDEGQALPVAKYEVTTQALPLSGEELRTPTVQEVTADTQFYVTTEMGTVNKSVQELEVGDILSIVRNGAVYKESVQAVRSLEQTAEAAEA